MAVTTYTNFDGRVVSENRDGRVTVYFDGAPLMDAGVAPGSVGTPGPRRLAAQFADVLAQATDGRESSAAISFWDEESPLLCRPRGGLSAYVRALLLGHQAEADGPLGRVTNYPYDLYGAGACSWDDDLSDEDDEEMN